MPKKASEDRRIYWVATHSGTCVDEEEKRSVGINTDPAVDCSDNVVPSRFWGYSKFMHK